MKHHVPGYPRNFKFEYRITLTYFIFGFIWILYSDKLLDLLLVDNSLLTVFQTFKGSFFIIVTSGFLYLLVKRHMEKLRFAESKRIESESYYRALFSDNLSVILLLNPDNGKIEDANKAACNYFGWTHSELCKKSIFEITNLDIEQSKTSFEALVSEVQNHFEFQHRLANGELRDVEVFTGPIWLKNRTLVYSHINDITEQKTVRETVRKNDERYRNTLDQMLEGCQIIGFDWKYIYLNRTAEIHNRRPNEELTGKKYSEMWPGIEATELFRNLQDCLNNRTSHLMENECVYSDGSKGWFNLSIQSVPEGVFILSTDISERIHAENYNLQANEILEHLINNTDTEIMITSVINTIKARTGYDAIAIRVKDGTAFPYYKAIGFNKDTERYLCSYDKNGNIYLNPNGDPITDCMCGSILWGRADPAKSYFTEGGSFRSNNTSLLFATTLLKDRVPRARNKCNSTGYKSVGLIPLRSGEEIIGLLSLNDHRVNMFNEETIPFFERIAASIGIAIMRNKIQNELKKVNEELEDRVAERTNQLMDSNKELESFAYSVSHDLRAPLRHVIGFSEKLDTELRDRNDPEVIRLTGKIKNSASKMSRLIDELLSYSRLGKTDLKKISLSLNTFIDEVIKEATYITKDRKIEWKIDRFPNVSADPTLIKLVLQNLIYNSIKFTSKLEKAVIEIGFREKNKKEYSFFVRDNGAGFNMQYAGKLFGVFQRLHTTEEFEGTGIGLAIVQRIIKRHNGSVWAEGIENRGATFFFTLPN